MLKDEVQTLRQVPLFAGVAPAKLKLLAFASDRVSYRTGETLFHQGDPGDAAYVILEGKADILAEVGSGQIKIAELEDNAIVGEIAILCDVSRTATVKAWRSGRAGRSRRQGRREAARGAGAASAPAARRGGRTRGRAAARRRPARSSRRSASSPST